jgi:hypothetical protein
VENEPNRTELPLGDEFLTEVVLTGPTPVSAPDAPIARLAPGWDLFTIPLVLLFAMDVLTLSELRAPKSPAWYLLPALLFSTAVVALAPLYLRKRHYSELLSDRVIVRQCSREWATPLAGVVSVELRPFSASDDAELFAMWILSNVSLSSRRLGPLPSRNRQFAYWVTTAYETGFRITPLPGADEFVQKLLDQKAVL